MPLEPEITEAVRTHDQLADGSLFDALLAAVRFEEVGKGRRAAVLVRPDEAGVVPLVRTTTNFGTAAQHFRPVHARLAEQIHTRASLPVGFNNALVETYTDACTGMGSHSDQALDLADGSFIAVYSCYKHPEIAPPPRTLLVESKEVGGGRAAFPLTHNGAVVFSIDTNRRLRHKIVLKAPGRAPENPWLGITFRTSKTLVCYRDGGAYFPNGVRLTLADDERQREFYRLRRRENDEPDFAYPPVAYTVSASDLMPPVESSLQSEGRRS